MQSVAAKVAEKAKTAMDAPYRVMLVDDSATVRGLMRNWLSTEPELEVVASCSNGLAAIQSLKKHDPEVIILDIEMPVMDGITALPEILKASPDVKVIVASTLTTRNAKISMDALSKGAADYIAKPDSSRGVAGSDEYKRTIVEKVKAFALSRRKDLGLPLPSTSEQKVARPAVNKDPAPKKATPLPTQNKLRARSKLTPAIIAIGSSTGGPQALHEVLKGLSGAKLLQPIVITQHMPKTFTTILAEHLSKTTDIPCFEAEDGQVIEPGKVYIAPGDYHMVLTGSAQKPVVKLLQTPPENFCRPSVDPMFRSISKIYGAKTLSIMLTGMGSDGLEGTRVVVDAGGTMIAQDEATSVVWGMPGAVSEAGLCSAILPLNKISQEILKIAQGR